MSSRRCSLVWIHLKSAADDIHKLLLIKYVIENKWSIITVFKNAVNLYLILDWSYSYSALESKEKYK